MKSDDEARARAIVDVARRTDLVDPAGVHHGDAVGHRHRLFLVVRHEDQRDAELLLQLLELELHALAQLAVERGERLVAQQHARPDHDRARQRDALLLAAGELRRTAILVALERDLAQRLADALL